MLPRAPATGSSGGTAAFAFILVRVSDPTTTKLSDDRELARRLGQRDPSALVTVLERYSGSVRELLLKRFPGHADVVESSLFAALHTLWDEPGSFDPERSSLGGYLFVRARSHVLRELKKMLPLVDLAELTELRHQQTDGKEGTKGARPSETRQRLQFLGALRRCVARLPALQRAIVEADLAAGDSAPAAPIAEAFGTSMNSVYVSRWKAYKKLRRLLTEEGYDLGNQPIIH
jgi:RNA polymerase sigma factor (sigma-70 family)